MTVKTLIVYVVAVSVSAIVGSAVAPKIAINPCAIVHCHGGPK